MSTTGSYTLASVNGRDVPAVWREVEGPDGQMIRSFWVDGRVELSSEGRYQLTLESALSVGGRTDDLGSIATRGRWHRTGSDGIAIYSDAGGEGRWQASSDLSVLVARSKEPGSRTIFVFLKD
jgi:hypothetical protein